MTKKDYGDYVQDILDSINETEEFVQGKTFEHFMFQSAVEEKARGGRNLRPHTGGF